MSNNSQTYCFQTLQFIVPFKDLPKKTLEIGVYDHDVGKHDDYIGKLSIAVTPENYFHVIFQEELFYQLLPKANVESSGQTASKIQAKPSNPGTNSIPTLDPHKESQTCLTFNTNLVQQLIPIKNPRILAQA